MKLKICSLLVLAPCAFLNAAELPSIVVTPAIYSENTSESQLLNLVAEIFEIKDFGTIENPEFTAHIVDDLVNSRKFSVLERSRLETIVGELDFGESDYADSQKVVEMGRMLNADYVLVPEIRFLLVRGEAKDIPYLNKKRLTIESSLGTSVRVIDVATSKILSSRISDVRLESRPKGENPPQEAVDLIQEIYETASGDIVSNLIDVVFPLKVLEVSGDRVVVNRGSDFLSEGDTYTIFKTGRELIDPDTGQNLGVSELETGSVIITRTEDKFSEAKVISNEGEILAGYILRKSKDADPNGDATKKKLNW